MFSHHTPPILTVTKASAVPIDVELHPPLLVMDMPAPEAGSQSPKNSSNPPGSSNPQDLQDPQRSAPTTDKAVVAMGLFAKYARLQEQQQELLKLGFQQEMAVAMAMAGVDPQQQQPQQSQGTIAGLNEKNEGLPAKRPKKHPSSSTERLGAFVNDVSDMELSTALSELSDETEPGSDLDSDTDSVQGSLPPPADPDAPAQFITNGKPNSTVGAAAAHEKPGSTIDLLAVKGEGSATNGDLTMKQSLQNRLDESTIAARLAILGKTGGVPSTTLMPSDSLGVASSKGNGNKSKGDSNKFKGAKVVKDGGKRERASRLEFKRLDHLYNKAIHDFYLAESTKNPADKDDKWEVFVFVVKRCFDWQNRYQKTVIDIKSPLIRDSLRKIFKNVKGVSLHEDKPSIDPNLLFNNHGEIKAILEAEKALPEEFQNKPKIEHLTLLSEYIETDYSPTAKRLFPLLENGEITFDLLWALFLPNTLVYTTCSGSTEPWILKLNGGQEKRDMQRGKFYSLDCHYVDYDGKKFGEARAIFEVPEFHGSQRIDQLPIYPLKYHQDADSTKEKLIARGRKFGNLSGMHYKYYKGLAFYKKRKGITRMTVQSRIMVDSLTFRRINPNYSMSPITPGSGRYAAPDDDEYDLLEEFSQDGATSYIMDSERALASVSRMDRMMSRLGARAGSGTGLVVKASIMPEKMTDEQLVLCSPTVLGFSFEDKMWGEFAVDHIHEIVFNKGAFDSLVLPESQKTIVRALVESHTGKADKDNGKKRAGIDDIIRGKGRGLVAVLHGRPGVGKTLTAEGISEYLQKPLYMVSAGELGTDSRTLEIQLSRILDVCYTWGAVLLLDEADVFLSRRSVHELTRNALVSIFLRLLEYFQGILFLTTNRVETFDEAFQSRIHIALKYNDLDRKAKQIIWKTFLDMVACEELTLADENKDEMNGVSEKAEADKKQQRQIISKDDLEDLARRNLNGRQIKNVVRTAQALAGYMKEDLSIEHLKRVLEVTEEFEHDLKGTGQIEGMMSYA